MSGEILPRNLLDRFREESNEEALEPELSGVNVEGRKKKRKTEKERPRVSKPFGRKTIFVPFQKQIILNEWEKISIKAEWMMSTKRLILTVEEKKFPHGKRVEKNSTQG